MNMKLIFILIMLSLFLNGCGTGDGDGSSGGSLNTGKFSGTIADNTYQVDVSCAYFNKGYFQFKSDKTDMSDTNGDGIIISGMETNGKFSLTIIDNGKTFSTGNLVTFSKADNRAKGSGKLFEENTGASDDVEFTVICE